MERNDRCILSVIVPVYNVYRYLERCLNSIVQQNIDNMEVILVDDGSTDESGMMCDEWAKKDIRIRVIHKKNEGLGYARNSGLAIATGQYVTFVDSDDYVAVDAFKKVLDRISTTSAEVCFYGYQVVTLINSFIKQGDPPNQLIYQGKDILTKIFIEIIAPTFGAFISPSACSGFYSRKLLNENFIRFLSERDCLAEDMFFKLDVCAVANSIVIYPDWLYYYCLNSSSLSRSYREDRFDAALYKFSMLENRLRQMDLYSIGNERNIRGFLGEIMVCLKQEVAHEKDQGKVEALRKIQTICENAVVRSALSEYKLSTLPLSKYLLFTALKLKQIKIVYFLVKIRDKLIKKW